MDTPSRTRIVRGELNGSRWLLASRAPRPELRPFVHRIEGYEEIAPGPVQMRQFPQTHVVVIIEFGPSLHVTLGDDERAGARNPGGFAAGLGSSHAITAHDGVQRGVQVDLTASGARRLFARPLGELTGRIVPLVELLAPGDRSLAAELADTPNWAGRLDLVESLLARRICHNAIDSACVDWAVGRIHATGGVLDMGSLARELGYSHKHVIALFRDQVGITPKLLARLVRFHRCLRLASEDQVVSGAEIALACGYYDQSHLARDVKQFTGLKLREARQQFVNLAELLG